MLIVMPKPMRWYSKEITDHALCHVTICSLVYCELFCVQVRRDNCPLVANLVNTCLKKILIDR